MKTSRFARAGVVGVVLVATAMFAFTRDGEAEFTTDFNLENSRLLPSGMNMYFDLTPGRYVVLEGEDDGEPMVVRQTVLDDVRNVTFQIDGQWMRARTRVVEEREWIKGELAEVSWNYYARCAATGNIYHFGEDVDIYEAGEVVSHEGTWLAGVDDAEPGLFMPGFFLLGSRYVLENAPGVALDRSENLAMNLSVKTPAGTFYDCIMTVDTTPLDPTEQSIKVYAPGVGVIMDDQLQLVEFGY